MRVTPFKVPLLLACSIAISISYAPSCLGQMRILNLKEQAKQNENGEAQDPIAQKGEKPLEVEKHQAKENADDKKVLQDLKKGLPDKLPFELNEKQKGQERIAAEKQAELLARELLGKIPAAARNQFRKNVLVNIQNGAEREFLLAMEQFISKHPAEVLDAADAYCRGVGLGSLKDRFQNSLVAAARQGMPVNSSKLNPVFADYATTTLAEFIESELTEIAKHEIMQDPLQPTEEWEEAERLFWEVHVWKNRFLSLDSVVRYAIGINQPRLERAIKQIDQGEINRLQRPTLLADQIKSAYEEMLEREAEMRMLELTKAEEVLRMKPDFERQLHAAFALEMHAGELEVFFNQNQPGNFQREKLNDQQFLDQTIALIESGRENGKGVIKKAVLLRVGAHWWLRGRYGMAAQVHGLLKPAEAMNDQSLMFGLYMPKERPTPIGEIDATTGEIGAGYERRHYFTWAVERRDVFRKVSRSTDEASNSQPAGSKASHFW